MKTDTLIYASQASTPTPTQLYFFSPGGLCAKEQSTYISLMQVILCLFFIHKSKNLGGPPSQMQLLFFKACLPLGSCLGRPRAWGPG